MSDVPESYWGVVGAVASAVIGWASHWLKERTERTKAVQAELKTFGSDIITELRHDLETARKDRHAAVEEAARDRDLAFRWRTEHTELAVENDGLRQLNESLKFQLHEALARNARLIEDIDRYQRELADTKDLSPRGPDDTNPSIRPRRR